MSQKILPKENSIYTNISLDPFQTPTQRNTRSSKSPKGLGINGDHAPRGLPTYNSIKSSKIFNHNNGFINICEDAPQGPGTGYSAFGTPASSIDLVCGRGPMASKLYVNDNFSSDAARIYISETTDLEDNFSMPKGDNIRQEARSGIGAQADVIAFKGKTGIKLTTGQYNERNSKDGKIRSGSGIELIAGTYTENLQPLVLGDNHVDSMKKIIKRINELTDAVINLAQVHNNSILLLQSHSHPLGVDPTTGLPGAAPSPVLLGGLALNFTDNTVMGIMNGTVNKINLLFDDINYLSALGFSSVSSDLNRTN
jgi:hypothetical protein